LKVPIYFQSVTIHSANGGNGEGWHVEEYSVALHAAYLLMLDRPSLMTSSNCCLVLLLLSNWRNVGGIPLAVEIPSSWVEPASSAPDSHFPHSARMQGVGAGPPARGKTAMREFPHTSKNLRFNFFVYMIILIYAVFYIDIHS
jgi:hypothetical protein